MSKESVLLSAAPERGAGFLREWRGQRPTFCCVMAHTDTCLLPGISAAGVSEALRAYTPAADAEALVYGWPRCLVDLPANPDGAPGPAGIARAAVRLADLPIEIVTAGLRVVPDAPHTAVECAPGGQIDLGRAVPEAARLYEVGRTIGARLAGSTPYLVLGESVPGGTTTALALLIALGFDAAGKVSGSLPGNAHAIKQRVVETALRVAGIAPGDGRSDPLGAAADLGDPMQPLAAGIALGAIEGGVRVLFTGGSQMVAVAALIQVLDGAALERLAVGTTRWVVQDPAADVPGLAAQVSPDLPLMAANLDFSRSRNAGLRVYEQFRVKEGVGAGGACIAALTATGCGLDALYAAIDAAYEPTPAK